MPDDQPTSWRSIVYGTAVLAADGDHVGEVREVLGSDEEDIFHGLRVRLAGQKRDVMVPSDDITALTVTSVTTSLTKAELEAIAPYDETATFHLASVGWLRRHLGWRQDSKGDEEPG